MLAAVLQLNPEIVTSAEKWTQLGVTGFLAIAVLVLWQDRQRVATQKDAMAARVTESLAAATEINRELRATLKDNVRAKEDLTHAIELLTQQLEDRPCLQKKEKSGV